MLTAQGYQAMWPLAENLAHLSVTSPLRSHSCALQQTPTNQAGPHPNL